MVEATPRLREYVDEAEVACCPTLDEELATLSAVETSVSEEAVGDELALLEVLADRTRYRILRILLESEERCVCELDALLEVTDSAISHALGKLVDADLVSRRKEGRWRIYAATERAERVIESIQQEVAG